MNGCKSTAEQHEVMQTMKIKVHQVDNKRYTKNLFVVFFMTVSKHTIDVCLIVYVRPTRRKNNLDYRCDVQTDASYAPSSCG